EGRIYLWYSAVLDLFGVIAGIGLVMAIVRRSFLRPGRLRLGSLWDDYALLWLMLLIVITGFMIEAMRIGSSELVSGTITSHGAANIFMRDIRTPKGLIPGSSLAPIKDFETAESFGAGRLSDFTWKQLMDVDVCVRCGRCEANCPATISGKELTPMGFLQNIK